MRRKSTILVVVVLALASAVGIALWPRNGEVAYLRSFRPHEHDEVVASRPNHVFDFEVPYSVMRARLDKRWGPGKELGDSEIYYKVPESLGLGPTVWLDAGRFDPNYVETREPDKACYLTLVKYESPLIERFLKWFRRII